MWCRTEDRSRCIEASWCSRCSGLMGSEESRGVTGWRGLGWARRTLVRSWARVVEASCERRRRGAGRFEERIVVVMLVVVRGV